MGFFIPHIYLQGPVYPVTLTQNVIEYTTLLITLYPSNKLEHLSVLLNAVLTQQPTGIFEPDVILVESPGMQHWVNMQLAAQQRIAMNHEFPLPVRFMWNTARAVLGQDVVPQQSPYRREVLVWRIEKILDSVSFQQHSAFQKLSQYWLAVADSDGQQVQRLQLSTALADVFEQYLLYRPDWLASWEAGETVDPQSELEQWQSEIWRRLVSEHAFHPAKLHQLAIDALNNGDKADLLPKRIIVFAINTMAPQLVQFLDALAHHTDIHLFHLNPSVNYWGDVQTNKAIAKQLREEGIARWMEDSQANPLLGNLGQQGRDLFNLLTGLDTFEISAFDTDLPKSSVTAGHELVSLQQDILNASYPVATPHDEGQSSVVIAKGHTALREVQGLHDFLLEVMSSDASIQPQDVVVMCPAIEDYAPVIDTVFHRIGSPELDDENTRLPCSIADRTPLDSEPMIAAFVSLLSLPDSRFEVSKIIDYLRLPGLQLKFGLSDDDLETIAYWLDRANIHWGLNGKHKSVLTKGATAHDIHSWHWGLKRLLIGMACEDQSQIVGNILTVPDVEGNQVYVLGQLIDLLERLGQYATALNTKRTASDWHRFLIEMRDTCFESTQDNQFAWDAIAKATSDLATHINEAELETELSLRQVREVLTRRFSMPDAGNHFMTGQVTFCSMLPMRSIPFKVVAILGLNDGEFPRQSTPLSIDLMAQAPRKLGDRSRRLEDRYLFLEAIISARQFLYLSYQANSAKDNSERQPSLVLQELQALMDEAYQWDESTYMRQLALHPFSPDAFQGPFSSFNRGWHRLASDLLTPSANAVATLPVLTEPTLEPVMRASAVGRALANPLAHFARQQLGIELEQTQSSLQDHEPFVADTLNRYQVLDTLVTHPDEWDQSLQNALLGGGLPQTPLTPQMLTQWQHAATDLIEVGEVGQFTNQTLSWHGEHIRFESDIFATEGANRTLHVGSQSAKRMLSQWVTHLICCASADAERNKPFECFYPRWKKGEHELRKVSIAPLTEQQAVEYLRQIEQAIVAINTQPKMLHADLGVSVNKVGAKIEGEWLRDQGFMWQWQNMVADKRQQDPYWQWFFARPPQLDTKVLEDLVSLYGPLAAQLKDKKL